jgi:serine/threonine protein kinase
MGAHAVNHDDDDLLDVDLSVTAVSDSVRGAGPIAFASGSGPNRVAVETSGKVPRYVEVDLPAGTPAKLGRYTLLRLLGRGGMAEVYLATQDGPAGFAKTCVVKRIRPHFAVEKRFVDMFLREARVAARLNHANIVQIFELGQEGNEFFIAMEHLDGITLHRAARRCWANDSPLPMEVALRSIADAAQGLAHAHDLHGYDGTPTPLIHRDISPDNLILTKDGVTKVLDFGIAKTIDEVDDVTKTGELKGKVPYMSPEQIKGDTLDGRSDLWSLGVTLYWLLTGRRPFDGGTDHMTIDHILRAEPAPPRDLNPLVPPAVQRIVLSLLEKDPTKRIENGHVLHDQLVSLLGPAAGTQTGVAFLRRVMELPASENQLQPGSVITIIAARPETEWFRRVSSGELEPVMPTSTSMATSRPSTSQVTEPSTNETNSQVMTMSRAYTPKRYALPVAFAVGSALVLLVAGMALLRDEESPLQSTAPPMAVTADVATTTTDDTTPPGIVGEQQGKEEDPLSNASDKPPVVDHKATADVTMARPKDSARSPSVTTMSVKATAPASVRWKNGKTVLGKGTTTLKVPTTTKSLMAEDAVTGGRVSVPIVDGRVSHEALGKGTLDLRVRPWAKVSVGSRALGTTPLDAVSLPAGDYTVSLEWEGKVKTKRVSLSKGKLTTLKVDMRE